MLAPGRPPRAHHGHPCQSLAPWQEPPHAGDPAHGGLVWYAAEHVARAHDLGKPPQGRFFPRADAAARAEACRR